MLSNKIAEAVMNDMLTGTDPLTVAEVKKVLAFVEKMEVGVTYPKEDMILFYKFLNKHYSIKSPDVKDYLNKRFISANNSGKALQLTKEHPLFILYADRVLNDKRHSFMNRIGSGLFAPIIKELAAEKGLTNIADYVFTERGYINLPKVITHEQYRNTNGLKLYRGFKNSDEIQQFISGEFYVSNWTAGSGVYFATDKEYAIAYASSEEFILECMINETDCKIADNEILIEAMTIDTEKGDYDLFYDLGIYGAVKGFEVINKIEFGYETKLILNRSIVYISEKEKLRFTPHDRQDEPVQSLKATIKQLIKRLFGK